MYFYRAFQNHTEKMRQKLHTEMKQKVDDEDERIAKTVAERERKRLVCFETTHYSLHMCLCLFMCFFSLKK